MLIKTKCSTLDSKTKPNSLECQLSRKRDIHLTPVSLSWKLKLFSLIGLCDIIRSFTVISLRPCPPAGPHQSRFPLLPSPLIVCIAASSKSFGPSTSYKLKLACHVSLRAMYLVVGLSRLRDGLCFVFPQSERRSLCHSGPPEWTSKHVSTSDSRPRAVYGSRIK